MQVALPMGAILLVLNSLGDVVQDIIVSTAPNSDKDMQLLIRLQNQIDSGNMIV